LLCVFAAVAAAVAFFVIADVTTATPAAAVRVAAAVPEYGGGAVTLEGTGDLAGLCFRFHPENFEFRNK
jgi:hypothetical protein